MNVKGIVHWTDIDMAELELEKLVTHYAQSNKAEGKSPKTISWYSEMLSDFVRFLKSTWGDNTLPSLNVNTTRQFIIYEQARGLSPYTVQGKVRALKAFSSWLFAASHWRLPLFNAGQYGSTYLRLITSAGFQMNK